MTFSRIPGNQDLKKLLVSVADSGRVPHALLFHENDGGGALALAQAFLQYLDCAENGGGEPCGACPSCRQLSAFSHPDVHYAFPVTSGSKVSGKVSALTSEDYISYFRDLAAENPFFLENELTSALGIEKKSGLISAAEARRILKKLSMATSTDGYRAIVLWLPEKMNPAAANALLKALEEPAPRTVFLLVTHAPEEVMPTIASRCLRLRVRPASKEELAGVLERDFGVKADEAVRAAEFAGGSLGQALAVLSESDFASRMQDLFVALTDGLVARDFEAVLQTGEELAALESREKQKAFCIFAGDCLRKLFFVQRHLETLSGTAPEEAGFYEKLAAACGSGFVRRSVALLDRAALLIDRNVNQKIVFCNLVTGMFVSIRKV